MVQDMLVPAGIALVLAGIALLIAGGLISGDADVEGGAVIFIGPIPIMLGSNKRMALAAALLGLLTLLGLWLFRG